MFLRRLSLVFLVVSLASLLCVNVEAAKGPKITHKVYFDIKQGDKELGRSESQIKIAIVPSYHINFSSYHGLVRRRKLLSPSIPLSLFTRHNRLFPRPSRTSVLLPPVLRRMVQNSILGTRAPNSTESSKTSCKLLFNFT